jgi:outer membrane protein assembly factor BamB
MVGWSDPPRIDHLYATDLDGDGDEEVLVFRELVNGTRIQAIDYRSGVELWIRDIEALSLTLATPMRRSGDTLIIVHNKFGEHQLVAFDLEDKTVRWRREIPGAGVPELYLHEGVAVTAMPDQLLHGVEVETGDRAWKIPTEKLTCERRHGQANGYLFASCQEPSSSIRLYRIALATGEYHGFPVSPFTAYRPDGTAAALHSKENSASGNLVVERLPPDATRPIPVIRGDEPVSMPYEPYDLEWHGESLLVARQETSTQVVELRAVPLGDGGPEFRWQVPDGECIEVPFGYRRAGRPSGVRPFYGSDASLVPMFLTPRGEDKYGPYATRLVLFDLEAGEPRWESRMFRAAERHRGGKDVVRHGDTFVVHMDGLEQFPPDAGDDAVPDGDLLVTLDAQTGEVVGAVQFDGLQWSTLQPETLLSDEMLLGIGPDGQEVWAVDRRTGEIVYGAPSAVQVRDVADRIESLLGPLPE